MSLIGGFTQAPEFRPNLNIGACLDIPTGNYFKGIHDEMILNGGLSHTTGIVARANMHKSSLMHHMYLTTLDRHRSSEGNSYDTEYSLGNPRLMSLAKHMPNIGGRNLLAEGRLSITTPAEQEGDEWFEQVKEMIEIKNKNKSFRQMTPFVDSQGNQMQFLYPTPMELDSISQFEVSTITKKREDNNIGAKEQNPLEMHAAMAKSQMVRQMPKLAAAGGMYIMMTAHVGDVINMDPHKPAPKKFQMMKGDAKVKDTPEKFTFLLNNCWHITRATPLINKQNGTPEFPRGSDDALKGDTDLMAISMVNLRGKFGPSGLPIELLCSQSDGLLPTLSEFYYLKNSDGFGLGGHDRAYFLELLPDVKMQRTTVRGKCGEDKLLQRAMEITSELCQLVNLRHDFDRSLLCTPEELYKDLKERGYDWDELLGGTRGYWLFENDEKIEPKKFLSTADLLRMRKGLYKPWWYDGAAR